jgi:methylmalonyl-CoA mutase cobalamin-binding domain/chain
VIRGFEISSNTAGFHPARKEQDGCCGKSISDIDLLRNFFYQIEVLPDLLLQRARANATMKKKSLDTRLTPADRLPQDRAAAIQSLRLRTRKFAEREGRRPRLLIAAVQREAGTYPAEQMASLLAEIGFDVDLQPVLRPLDDLARMAVDNDVHALLIIGAGRAKRQILQDLVRTLENTGGRDVLLALDDAAVCDILMQSTPCPVVWFQNAGPDSAARLLDSLEQIQCAR